MKRVKAVEDLNICIIGAGGIVGVGAKSLKFIDNWSRRARRAAELPGGSASCERVVLILNDYCRAVMNN